MILCVTGMLLIECCCVTVGGASVPELIDVRVAIRSRPDYTFVAAG